MSCTYLNTVGRQADGKTLAWSPKKHKKEFATFKLPCGKCIDCRLGYASEWAMRCMHEAEMYGERNSFVTLTYDDKYLESSRLIYPHFQKFMKRLRRSQSDPIGVLVTGEYGDQNKRPHWHAIIFNWRPSDGVHIRRTPDGDDVYESATLDKLWGKGLAEFGSVTYKSAGYVARYAAKKLVHGRDGKHNYDPISKKSSQHAIGKKWIEKYWPDVFNHGYCIRKDGSRGPIPRYYKKWFQENHPDEWLRYVTDVKLEAEVQAYDRESRKKARLEKINDRRRDYYRLYGVWLGDCRRPEEAHRVIQKQKFEKLQSYLKL